MPYHDGWTLICDAAALHDYRLAFCAHHGLAVERMVFGSGPVAYPCLATAVPIDASRALTAYVYPADAAELMAATAPEPAVAAPSLGSQQEECNRVVSAHLMTLIKVMKDLKLFTDAQYEKWLTVSLAKVDQWNAEDKHQRRPRLSGSDAQVLPKLYPRKKGKGEA